VEVRRKRGGKLAKPFQGVVLSSGSDFVDLVGCEQKGVINSEKKLKKKREKKKKKGNVFQEHFFGLGFKLKQQSRR